MLARCARCQGTFTTDRFGRQTCPHCGSELLLQDPSAPRQEAPPGGEPASPPSPPSPPPAGPGPAWGAPPPPPEQGAGGPLPPPPGPPPGGYGPPPGGYGPPPGGWPPPPGGGWGGPPGGPPRGPEEPPIASPFAERAQRGFLGAFFETWKLVAVEPQRFFRRVRIDQTGTAVLFGVIAYAVGTAVQALYTAVSGAQGLAALEQLAGRLPPEQAQLLRSLGQGARGGFIVGEVILAPLIGLIGIYLSAGILHLLLMLFRGANRPFDATLTAVGYAFGLYLLLAVPACGGLIAVIWVLVVLVIGLGESQRCGPGRAAAAVLAPLALVCVCCCGAGLIGAGGFLKAMSEAAKSGQTTL